MEKRSIIDGYLPVLKIEKIVKGRMPRGRVVPLAEHRQVDFLGYVYSGEVIYQYKDGYSVTVRGGDVLYIPRGGAYYYDVLSENYEYVYADLIFGFPPETEGKGESFPLKNTASVCRTLFEQMYNQWTVQTPGYYESCAGLLCSVMARLIQTGETRYTSSASRQLAGRCAVILRDHCTDPDFRISSLGDNFDCSDAHLRRVFRASYGMPPAAYLTQMRIDNAKTLLSDTNLSIVKIGELSGFQDGYYFSRTFRKTVGCSPSEYRKRIMKSEPESD